MKNVKVKKHELMSILGTNRLKHIKEYEESLEEFKQAAIKTLTDTLEDVKDKTTNISIHIPAPESYIKEYDRAIRMLELSVEDFIVLEEHEFKTLVQDEWSWKTEFLNNKTIYNKLSQ